jgi:hypothetical protein
MVLSIPTLEDPEKDFEFVRSELDFASVAGDQTSHVTFVRARDD